MVGTIRIRELTARYPALIVLIASLALIAVIACGDDPQERVFSAPEQGSFVPTECAPSGNDLVCTFALNGNGGATHLGTFSEAATWEIQIDNGAVDPTSPKGSILSGSATLTGTNGDTIRLSAVAGSRLDDGVINAVFNIVGGTGKFEGATGLITRSGVFGIVDPENFLGSYNITYTGTITY